MSNLDKVVNKSNGITDWNYALKSVWADDSQRPPIYSNDHGGHYWDGRNLVQELLSGALLTEIMKY